MISIKYIHLPMIFFMVILVYGLYLVFLYDAAIDAKGKLVYRISNNKLANSMLKKTGLNITGKTYYLFLYSIGLFIAILSLVKAIKDANLGVVLLGILIAFAFIWAFRPIELLYNKITSPFAAIIKILTKSRADKLDKELYSSCIVLKNLAIVQSEAPLSADTMLETLAKSSKLLKPIYAETLSYYRTGRSENAFKYFGDAVGTSMGKTFAGLLSKLDKVNPEELKEQTIAIQDAMSERRLTQGYKKAQSNGVITMVLSTVAVMAVMMDFLVVVIFMDLMQMMTSTF